MTTIHFHYTDSYNNPSRGSLAFMPHRRHAANETEVLPKPFTIPLLNGEVTVNLQPNSSSWVWIVTEYFEDISKSFFTTIPDRDGVLEHTELIHISPSSIPAPYDAVEPVWWAEMRQYKTTVSDTLLESGEALTEARAAIETGRESVERTQHNASLAKAYAEESREDSYASRDYRDEAEQWRNEAKEQADRAASGPESAAQRAENAALASENNEVATRGYRDEARNSASEARSSETAANGSASTATERASDARNEANRAESEANRAKGYADELMDGPRDYVEQAETARDKAMSYRDEAGNHASSAQGFSVIAQGAADNAETHQSTTLTLKDEVQVMYNELSTPHIASLWGVTATELDASAEYDVTSFQNEETLGEHLSISNGIITVNTSGWYTVDAAVRFSASTGTEGAIQLRIEGARTMTSTYFRDRNTVAALSVSKTLYLEQGSELKVTIYNGRGDGLRLADFASGETHLTAHYVR